MIGDYLKKCRQKANLSLEDVSATTMVKLSYLKALEDEDFQSLPCEVYTKGYIRVYLESMSVDSAEGLRIFQEEGLASNVVGRSNHIRVNTGAAEAAADLIRRPYAFTSLEKHKPDYTRPLVYVLVFLAFLVVIVYSTRLFSFTKGSNTSATRSVDSVDNRMLRNTPPSDKLQTPPTLEKGSVMKSSGSKKPALKPSIKIKESMNFIKMSVAEASIPSQPQPSTRHKPELTKIDDMSRAIVKMKHVTASLKSLKTAIEKVKYTGVPPGNNKPASLSESRIEVQPDTPGGEVANPQTNPQANPQLAVATPTKGQELNIPAVDDSAISSSKDSDISGTDLSGVQPANAMGKCEMLEKGNTF
ncbi:MAG: helix-turn-helix domain-containing protein [Nitrospirae bacterium]|nr:helix-turn-helix domain-containing protein [Nitrospirota bacterium]